VVSFFDVDAGVGTISADASEVDVFFSFTAIPGEGYRTLRPGTPVEFEVVDHPTGPTARNVRKDGNGAASTHHGAPSGTSREGGSRA
jgi:cold shock CspA family protein